MRRSKDEVAAEVIARHFKLFPEYVEIYRIRVDGEEDAGEPIKLLEVDPESSETGRVDSFHCPLEGDMEYAMVIAYVTPNELHQVQCGALELPEGWTMAEAQRFTRDSRDGEGAG